MVNPVTRLYIHVPLAPRPGLGDLGGSPLEAQFTWYCDGANGKSGVGRIHEMPYADEAYVFIPTIDVRFVSLVVPTVSRKKLQTILPTLLEEHLLSTQPSQTMIFVPRAGQPVNQRIVAVMDRSWYDWVAQELNVLIAARIIVLADCFVLPAPTANSSVPEFYYTPAGSMLSMQVRRSGLQTGVAFLEQATSITTPLLRWDWSWVSGVSLDEAALQTNLIHQLPRRSTSAQPRVSGNWSLFIRQVLLRLNGTIGIALGAFLIYCITLYMLDWKWQSDMYSIASKAVQDLPPAAGTSTKDRSTNAISTLIDIARHTAHRQGQLSSTDFVWLASQLQQLRAQLPADAITQIEYQDGNLIVQMRSGIDIALVLVKAKELGMALVILGPQRFRLLGNAGLESLTISHVQDLP